MVEKTIYSLRELHDLVENHDEPHRMIIFFDIDLTIVKEKDDYSDMLIEPEITKDLFAYLIDNRINFCFVTARFHDTVCDHKTRDLVEMKDNIEGSIFPILEELGIDLTPYRTPAADKEVYYLENGKGEIVGVLYKGIFFGARKGEIIKHYRKEMGLDMTHPHTVLVDDLMENLEGAKQHVPNIILLKRDILEELS
jgi:hypothetical protein